MSGNKTVVARHDTHHGTVRSYTVGFVLSLILTLAAYLLVVEEIWEGWALVGGLAVLAVAQLLVQLVYFLHLGRESKPRWNLMVLLFAVMVVATVVFGSLWIMRNIEYNHEHMTPSQTDDFIKHDEGY